MSVSMVAPQGVGGTVTGTPSGKSYAVNVAGQVADVLRSDIAFLAGMGFTSAANGPLAPGVLVPIPTDPLPSVGPGITMIDMNSIEGFGAVALPPAIAGTTVQLVYYSGNASFAPDATLYIVPVGDDLINGINQDFVWNFYSPDSPSNAGPVIFVCNVTGEWSTNAIWDD